LKVENAIENHLVALTALSKPFFCGKSRLTQCFAFCRRQKKGNNGFSFIGFKQRHL